MLMIINIILKGENCERGWVGGRDGWMIGWVVGGWLIGRVGLLLNEV